MFQIEMLYILIRIMMIPFIILSSNSFARETSSVDTPAISQYPCTPLTSPIYYTVHEDEHLADIIRTFQLKPIWDPKNGFLIKIAKLNNISDINLIFPGDTLQLPLSCEEDLVHYKTLNEDTARKIDNQYLLRLKTHINPMGETITVQIPLFVDTQT